MNNLPHVSTLTNCNSMHLIGSSHRTNVKYPVKGSDIGHLADEPEEEEEEGEGEGDEEEPETVPGVEELDDGEVEIEACLFINRAPVIKKSGIDFA